MSTRTLLILVIVVAVLVAGAVYLHRPRGHAADSALPQHGDR
jgi:preprotein translocase subunit SecG